MKQLSDVSVSQRAGHTCVIEHSGPPARRAGGISYASFHPDVNFLVLNELLLEDLLPSLACAGKLFTFAAIGFVTPVDETVLCDQPATWKHCRLHFDRDI